MSASQTTTADRVRQVGVTAAEIFCVVGSLIGAGVLGTAVENTSGGVLSADATHLAPAGAAFSIWSVVYLGLAAYTVWQWLPSQAAAPRQRSIGWLAAASMVLNATWLLVTQQGWIWVSVVVIVVLVLVLGLLVQRLTEHAPTGTLERVVVDGTFGLYLGWVAVAVCANIAAALLSSGVEPGETVADLLAIGVLAVVAALSVLLAARFGGRWAVAAATAWGLTWIAIGRSTEQPESVPTAVAAVAAAAVTLLATGLVRARS